MREASLCWIYGLAKPFHKKWLMIINILTSSHLMAPDKGVKWNSWVSYVKCHSYRMGLSSSWELDEESVWVTADGASNPSLGSASPLPTVKGILPESQVRRSHALVQMHISEFSIVKNVLMPYSLLLRVQYTVCCMLRQVCGMCSMRSLSFLNVPPLLSLQLVPHTPKSLS